MPEKSKYDASNLVLSRVADWRKLLESLPEGDPLQPALKALTQPITEATTFDEIVQRLEKLVSTSGVPPEGPNFKNKQDRKFHPAVLDAKLLLISLLQRGDMDPSPPVHLISVYQITLEDPRCVDTYLWKGTVKNYSEQEKIFIYQAYGLCQYQGISTLKSDPLAFAAYQKAANLGSAHGRYMVGLFYEEGKGVGQSLSDAFAAYQQAAELGSAHAYYKLGLLYEEGKGVEQSSQAASTWYQKAADQGYADAQYRLGLLYQQGKGVEQSLQAACTWYKKAANQGHVEARNQLIGCPKKFCSNKQNEVLSAPKSDDSVMVQAVLSGMSEEYRKEWLTGCISTLMQSCGLNTSSVPGDQLVHSERAVESFLGLLTNLLPEHRQRQPLVSQSLCVLFTALMNDHHAAAQAFKCLPQLVSHRKSQLWAEGFIDRLIKNMAQEDKSAASRDLGKLLDLMPPNLAISLVKKHVLREGLQKSTFRGVDALMRDEPKKLCHHRI